MQKNIIQIRVDNETKKEIFKESKRLGVTASSWIKHLISQAIEYKPVTKKLNRIGEMHKCNDGTFCEIIEYKNANNLKVKFENGYITQTSYRNLTSGNVMNVLNKTVYSTGFIGIGNYSTQKNRKMHPYYRRWNEMLKRCYNEKCKNDKKTYKEATVCEEWHNFQNFAKWCEKNYVENYDLDKDILVPGNKIYSPETCCFVPQWLNQIFRDYGNKSKSGLQGAYEHKGKYRSYINRFEKSGRVFLGNFNSKEEAHVAYLKACVSKLEEVKAKAEKENLSNDLVNAIIQKQSAYIKKIENYI